MNTLIDTLPLIIPGIYIVVMFVIWLWDSYIGFGLEFNGYEAPPLFLVCLFWPLAIPFMLIYLLDRKLVNVKANRKDRENKQEKIRIAKQKEIDTYIENLDAELERSRRAKQL